MGCFGRFWEALAASVRCCKALDALEGFGLWQVCKALGSFDVNMVCPLPGLWINHVVETWMRIIKVSCLSVNFFSQPSPISCFLCIFPGKGLGHLEFTFGGFLCRIRNS